jgi:hypothetical protein
LGKASQWAAAGWRSKKKGGPKAAQFTTDGLRRSERDPDAAFVVTAAFMIVAIVMVFVGIPFLVKIPVVGVIIETDARRVNTAFGMPAITIVVAGKIGGCRDGRGHQSARRHERGKGGGGQGLFH